MLEMVETELSSRLKDILNLSETEALILRQCERRKIVAMNREEIDEREKCCLCFEWSQRNVNALNISEGVVQMPQDLKDPLSLLLGSRK